MKKNQALMGYLRKQNLNKALKTFLFKLDDTHHLQMQRSNNFGFNAVPVYLSGYLAIRMP